MIQSSKNTNFSLENGPFGPSFNHPNDHISFWTYTKIIFMVTTDPLLTQKDAKKGLRTF